MQWIKLFTFDDTDVMVSSRDSFFSADEIYSRDLAYAFGITAYDSNAEAIEDPSIGTLKAYYKTWGLHEGGGVKWEPIPTRDCSQAELHINN